MGSEVPESSKMQKITLSNIERVIFYQFHSFLPSVERTYPLPTSKTVKKHDKIIILLIIEF